MNPILRTSLLRQIWGYMYIFFSIVNSSSLDISFKKYICYIYIWCPKKTDIEKNPSASSQASAANADVFLSKTYCTSFPSCTHDCSSNSLEANVLDSENRKAWALYICIYINYINYKTVFIFYVFDILKLIYLIYIYSRLYIYIFIVVELLRMAFTKHIPALKVFLCSIQ